MSERLSNPSPTARCRYPATLTTVTPSSFAISVGVNPRLTSSAASLGRPIYSFLCITLAQRLVRRENLLRASQTIANKRFRLFLQVQRPPSSQSPQMCHRLASHPTAPHQLCVTGSP